MTRAEGATPHDVHSHARPQEARVRHVSLDLVVDFAARRLHGRAALDLDVAPGAAEVVLDTMRLEVEGVTDAGGRPLDHALGPVDPILGQPLTVALPAGMRRVVVAYRTSPEAPGLLWLAPEQTADGRLPFVFTQGHAILTRSWLPTQDSLGVRQSYDARVTVPEGLTVVMSAESLAATDAERGGQRFAFRQEHPIPPYLIAFAAGELAFRAVGARTGVWAEPALLERAREEFAELETMLDAAEGIAGPYRWGRADVLVLPPSFPFGGMENPRLTFASATLLAGDRSLATVVAHELAHAWPGNLVTPATWSDFWLNEGLTVYLELRVAELLRGAEHAAMLEVHGHQQLAATIERLGPSSPDTRLRLELAGRDPADAVTVVPYVKGAALLRAIEQMVGRERLDAFLCEWFARHAFGTVTSETFAHELRERLLRPEERTRIDLDAWIDGPGLPADAPRPRSAALDAVEGKAAAFAAGAPAAALVGHDWSPQQWRHFLNVLPRALPHAQLRDLDATYALSASGNAEVRFAWLRLALGAEYSPALPAAERFLTAQGRGKFVRPLYETLARSEWGRAAARRIYAAARPRYHAAVAAAVDRVLG